MKKTRLGPKHANRRIHRSPRRRNQLNDRSYWNQVMLKILARHCPGHRQVTEKDILLRLINILGLILLVMSVAILSDKENLKEIMDMAGKLFPVLP